ncbi:CaiB/BaiF CoA transferase family protein [Gandjariella thermophila]|uniref:CoA transferase n=1 Tax=Gandjariella thermophila TaxID=1931992 RepID=A0A4D4J916_9PSEU|nr:CaiB/BaiF CoA-transferase family protein [Gandjariella thermophila]GDY30447.1 CoA transferase [Gandjariella thermophila]
MALPLAGVVVVSVEQAVAAPFATRQLADLGARVIKIERPRRGDFARGYDRTVRGQSSHFVWLNRAKESVALDLKHPEAGPVLARLLDRADVFVQNLAPGAAARLGLDPATVRATRPRLITCEVSGYGRGGPYADRKAYDLLVQAEAGLPAITGTPDEPAKAGIAVADIAAGMYAFSGVLAALLERERTGSGRAVEVSMLDALAEWMGYPFYYAAYGGRPPERTGAAHATIAPYGPFTAGDGRSVLLAVQNDPEWHRFCGAVLGKPELADDPRFATNAQRVAHRAELHAVVDERLVGLSGDELVRLLEQARIAYASMNDVGSLDRHPQLVARDRIGTVDSPGGPLRALLPPIVADGWQPRMDPIPEVGEHTEAVLRWAGLGAEDVARLRASGALSESGGSGRGGQL